jgi:hypothetical protein
MKLVTRTELKGRAWGLLLTAAVLALGPSFARADNLDKELVKKAPEILAHLQKQGYKNIGVLKFMVKKGKSDLSFNSGAINHNLATRLENALILAVDPEKPIGIIRDATTAAAVADPKHTHLTPEGRTALFKVSYPLAWGNQKVTADAFLSGIVVLSPDMKETTVQFVVFDRKSAKLEDLKSANFKVGTDRSILADSGQSFVLSKRSMTKRDGFDEEAVANSASLDPVSPTPTPTPGSSIFDTYLKLEVKYDGQAQSITPDSASGGEFKMSPDPKEGQKVEFVLNNISGQRLGVLLKINGKSAFGGQEDEDDRCALWILETGASATLRGFYDEFAKKVDVFKVLSDEESRSAWANHKRPGFIDVAVYTESGAAGEENQFSIRGMSKRSLAKVPPPTTLAAAKEQLRNTMGATKRGRGLIAGSGNLEEANLKPVQFNSPQMAGHAHINYHTPLAP